MPTGMWWFWLVLGLAFLVIEMATAGFFVVWFGLAALLAMGANLLHWPPVWQWVIFLVFSTIGAVLSRRFARMFTRKEPDRLASEEVLDHVGKVIDELKDNEEAVLGKFQGETWRCFPADKSLVLKIGDKLKAIEIEGTHLIVERIDSENTSE
ncbi:NfeD family protein [bacterium]|nr:NfeD family protein [bacterium]